MDLRKIKLNLTIALLNNASEENAPEFAKDQLKKYGEVGKFLGTRLVKRKTIGKEQIERQYTIRFEHCTLCLQMISNLRDYSQVVNSFQLSGNLA